jgi:hypothetical protein
MLKTCAILDDTIQRISYVPEATNPSRVCKKARQIIRHIWSHSEDDRSPLSSLICRSGCQKLRTRLHCAGRRGGRRHGCAHPARLGPRQAIQRAQAGRPGHCTVHP